MSLADPKVLGNTLMSADVHEITPDQDVLDLPQSTAFRMRLVRITPEVAVHWLKSNRANRRLYKDRVKQYADDMIAGKFHENGDTIAFTKSHLLMDGQHRLHAVIASGIALKSIVVVGLDDEARITKDTGKTRSPKDNLGIESIGDWEAGVLGTSLHSLIAYFAGRQLAGSVKATNHAIRDFYLEHTAALNRSLGFIKEMPRKRPVITHSRALVLHYLFSIKDADLADEFMTGLFTGELLVRGDPAHFLREVLIASQIDRKPRSSYDQWFACVKAWNFTRGRKTIQSGRVLFPRRDEAFPDIK